MVICTKLFALFVYSQSPREPTKCTFHYKMAAHRTTFKWYCRYRLKFCGANIPYHWALCTNPRGRHAQQNRIAWSAKSCSILPVHDNECGCGRSVDQFMWLA